MCSLEEVLDLYRYHPQFLGLELVSVNQKGAMGDTPLHIACNRSNLEDVRALIDLGADVNAQGDLGMTPLHVAISCGAVSTVKLLLEAGARTDIASESGETARDAVKYYPKSNPIRQIVDATEQ